MNVNDPAVFPEIIDLAEISSLIKIRDYMNNAVSNFSIPREKVKKLHDMLIALDQHIIDQLIGQPFRKFLGYDTNDIKQFVSAAREANDIKAGMKPR